MDGTVTISIKDFNILMLQQEKLKRIERLLNDELSSTAVMTLDKDTAINLVDAIISEIY